MEQLSGNEVYLYVSALDNTGRPSGEALNADYDEFGNVRNTYEIEADSFTNFEPYIYNMESSFCYIDMSSGYWFGVDNAICLGQN